MLPVKIVSTGCYIPSTRVLSSELDVKFGIEIGTVEKKTGIHTRYYGNETETSPYMGAQAVKAALDRAQLTLDDIDAVVSVSGTAAQLLPCTASLIVAALGRSRRRLAAFDINATCLSFLIGFDNIAQLVAVGRYRRVVLVASENGSSCLSPHEIESASLIGDAAVAMIIERSAPDEPSAFGAASFDLEPDGVDYCVVRGLGTVCGPMGPRPASPEDIVFTMQGPKVFRLASEIMPRFMDRFLTENQCELSEIDLFVPHQASGFGVSLMCRRLGLPEDRTYVYLRDYGNTIAASIPLGLHFAIEAGQLKRGHKVLMLGTGAGLALGVATFVY